MTPYDSQWDKVLINNLTVDAILGILPNERVQTQQVVINLTIFTDTQPAAKSQNIADTLNYAELASQAAQLTVEGEYLLIESLVEDLAALTLDHPTAKAVTVRVEKPQAVRDARSVGVEIYRQSLPGPLERS
jgi:FolB domain-containing protein